MIWYLLIGCGDEDLGQKQSVAEPSSNVPEAVDWMLGFGTSMDGDIEPCG